MTTKSTRFMGLAAAMLFLAIPAMGSDEEGIDAKVAFARMKTLAGSWKPSGPNDHGHGDEGHAKVIYQVTAAGSSLMQTQFPGEKHEMVTMYHLDGKDLLAVHYCAAGNQPRLKLDRKASKPDDLVFVFDGGTNLDVAKDTHIHVLRVKFLADGKVEEEWDGYTDGKKADCVKIPMSRL